MRGLAEGKGDKKTAKAMKEKFVFLNVYCRSVKEEHEPRGPKGPYQFVDRSVPVCVIKKWDGTTFNQKLGFVADPKAGMRNLESWMVKALKDSLTLLMLIF